jgi:hypothetical protein
MSELNAERWHALSPYLDEVLDVPADGRIDWLARFRDQHPALAADLEALLDEQVALRRERFLEQPQASLAQSLRAGQIVGAYAGSPIGQGGMGVVWSKRSDGRFDRRAAVKFLNVALAGRAEERFTREGVLGRLVHRTSRSSSMPASRHRGRLITILEHVDGQPIDQYCEQHRLDGHAPAPVSRGAGRRARARESDCPSRPEAVERPRVETADFGIAKLLDDSTGPANDAEGEAALTPNAPPLNDRRGDDGDRRLQLGVVLYVLLGASGRAGRASPMELMKSIVEVEARRPGGAAVAARSGRSDHRRQGAEEDPAARYISVTALADDLRRSLRHEPIGETDTLVIARTFVRRHQVARCGGLLCGQPAANARPEALQDVRQLASRPGRRCSRALPGSSKTRQFIVNTALEYLQRLTADAAGDPELALEVGTAYMRVARVQGVPISANLGQLEQSDQTLQKAEAIIESLLVSQPANRTAIFRSAQIAHDRMILAGLRRPEDEAMKFARRSTERLDQYLRTGRVDPADAQQFLVTYQNVARRYTSRSDRRGHPDVPACDRSGQSDRSIAAGRCRDAGAGDGLEGSR